MLQTAFRASVFVWHKRFKEARESVSVNRASVFEWHKNHERFGTGKEVNTPELIGQMVRMRRRVTMLRF